MMNSKYKRIWLKALRSGDYKQGQNHLKNKSGTMCCLGVLCDTVAKHNPDDRLLKGVKIMKTKIRVDDDSEDMLSMRMLTELKIVSEGTHLATMNDKGVSFSRIADYIEQNL